MVTLKAAFETERIRREKEIIQEIAENNKQLSEEARKY